jgi:phage-related protein
MKARQRLPAIFYCSSSGHEPVRQWLKSLSTLDRKVIGEDIAYVQFKWPIGKPRVDYLKESVWEVRSSIGNRIARVMFAVVESQMILLHGFVKKTQKTPASDIDVAIKRFKEWKHEHEQNQ